MHRRFNTVNPESSVKVIWKDGMDWPGTILVDIDHCPYCGAKDDTGDMEMFIWVNGPGSPKSVVFHSPHRDPNSICEIPDSYTE